MSTPVATAAPTSLRGPGRSLAPDLARGAMLLLIALANTPWYLYGTPAGLTTVHPAEGGVLDRVVQAVVITAVDSRVYPMFAFLFGYGIVQLHRRQTAAGVPERDVRRVLRRRHLWMLLLGLLHAGLLWYGDILGAYGLVGLVAVAAFLRRRDTTLVVWAAVLFSLLATSAVLAVGAAVALVVLGVPVGSSESFLELVQGINGIESWPASVPVRLGVWPFLVLGQGVLSLVIPICVLLAFWAARHGVLEHPEQHRLLLRRVAVAGISVAWLGGLPHALHHVGVLGVPDGVSWVFSVTQSVTGLAGGVGYVALFGLLAARLGRRGAGSGPVLALTAVGKRSLSCYLAQSVLCAPLLAAWGLGVGGWLGSAGTAALAVGVWLLTVAGAVALERAGRRGPAETLLRWLSYPRRAVPRPG
ncbi:DUF418 domain-containing protein [Auraticoccus sp. F435]|uniref:DUF418 domain-containing protein n=1 Tax=Auraticoccus cholistanensis TaxID=2656650 RepID=A0A6A9V253_9ACTN|nr:DUF418 domain-containing protein [Auraticoccus cholistanensis]MVA77716.1 DUF418 domain-containing protein [Auraticoccus cholistanensis]